MDSEHTNTPVPDQQFWLTHIRSCTEQEGTMADYARSHDLKVTALYYWKKRLMALGLLPQDKIQSAFTAVRLAPNTVTSAGYQIHFPNGIVMQWSGMGGVEELEPMLRMLSQLP